MADIDEISGGTSVSTATVAVVCTTGRPVPMSVVENFDYLVLPPDTAEQLRKQAARIRGNITVSVIEIGRELLKAKELLDHGQFIAWVESEVGIMARSAQRYIGAAELCNKNDTVSLLPPTTIYLLAAKSTPKEVVNEVIAKAAAGEILPRHVVSEKIDKAKRDSETKRKQDQRNKRRTKAWQAKQAKREADREAERIARERMRQHECEERNSFIADWILQFPEAARALVPLLKHECWWEPLEELRVQIVALQQGTDK